MWDRRDSGGGRGGGGGRPRTVECGLLCGTLVCSAGLGGGAQAVDLLAVGALLLEELPRGCKLLLHRNLARNTGAEEGREVPHDARERAARIQAQ